VDDRVDAAADDDELLVRLRMATRPLRLSRDYRLRTVGTK
jgi:hypothetical protein